MNFKKAKKLGKVRIQITAAKSSSYAPATRKLTITTVKGTPSVSCVQQQERKIYDGAFNLGAKADQNATLVYSSSNSAIASVASDGTVTFEGMARKTISERSADHSYYKKYNVL